MAQSAALHIQQGEDCQFTRAFTQASWAIQPGRGEEDEKINKQPNLTNQPTNQPNNQTTNQTTNQTIVDFRV
jgi:hypothetical protein